jgi:hypothetical protein
MILPKIHAQGVMTNYRSRDFFSILAVLATLLLSGAACGYHVRGSGGALPSGIQSIGIPTFRNLTNQYTIEQIITAAVLKEFALRTGIPIRSSNAGMEAVLLGEIRGVNSTPVTFEAQSSGSQTFGTAFLVTVQMSVKLVRQKDSSTVWQNDNYVFQERYVLNGNVRDFFSEENPALARLSRDFANSLVSAILDRTKP